MQDDGVIGKVKIAIIIGIVIATVMGCGCTKYTLSSDASPSEVVKIFAARYGAENFEECYLLMSEEYRNSTDYSTFKEKMIQCKPTYSSQYEFVEVRSEKNDGDSASVQIIYVKKSDALLGLPDLFNKPKNKTKPINLIKEDKGWRLTDLHCELKGK
jgi:hypothetical protein